MDEKKNELDKFENMIDEFYLNDGNAKIEYQGIYAVEDADSTLRWNGWVRNAEVKDIVKSVYDGTAQKIACCFGNDNNARILLALVDLTVGKEGVSLEDLTQKAGSISTEQAALSLGQLEQESLISVCNSDSGTIYSVPDKVIEGFITMLTGIHHIAM